MNPLPTILWRQRRSLLAVIPSLLLPQLALAQAVPAKPAATVAPSTDEVVELTPFQVDASKDRGYFGANTMSGTRLNSRVQDLGGSITVVTKQQLDDTASIDINDIFKYEANTEGIYDYTAITTSSPTTDIIQGGSATSGGPQLATRVRGLTAPNITIDYFTHTARIPIDSYILDSVEISRGPNSSVAGLGSPSGTINQNTSPANLTRDSNQAVFRADSYGGYRASLNFNRVLWKDKLALRVAALYGDQEFKQKPSYDLTKRLYGALTYKPFKFTTLNLRAEHYAESRQAPNSLTPRDGVSEWIAAGRPTWNPLTFTATTSNGAKTVLTTAQDNTAAFPAGLYVNTTTYTRPSFYIDGGQVQLWEINRLGTSNNPNNSTASNVRMLASGSAYMRGLVNSNTLYTTPGITNKSLYDWTSINAVPTNWNYDHAALYTAELEQKIYDTLYFRAAWHLEDSVEYNRNITSPTLQVDVNQFLLDGRANPYFERPYISSIEPSIFRLPEYNDAKQAALTYSLDLSQRPGVLGWLGRHQLGANYESRFVTQGTFRYREAVSDPNHIWLTPGALNYTNGAAIGRPDYVYYVGPTGAVGYTPGYTPPKSGVAGNFNFNWFNGATNQWVSEPAAFNTLPYITSLTRQETTTHSATWQGNLFKDYLVVTGGLRKDAYRTRNSLTGAVVDGNTGLYTYDALKNWGPWTYASGPTRFISGVLYPFHTRVLGLTYSRSSSFQPQPQAVDLFDNLLPNTYGHGQDAGAFVNLLGNKLVLSVKFYKTTIANDRTSNSTIGSRIARIEEGGVLAGTSADTFSLYNFGQAVAKQRLGNAATQAQIDAVAATITQFPTGIQNAVAASNSGAAIRGTADTEAKGAELELTYNPTNNWAIKFSGAQTESINKTIENNLQSYIDSRLTFWQNVKDDQGLTWWDGKSPLAPAGTSSAQNFYNVNVVVPIRLDQALLGKSNPQVKKYTWRLLSTYRFSEGKLKNVSVGGALRWDDKSVIGYLAGAPDADGIVRTLDVNKGVYDPSRYAADFWINYTMKLYHDKVRAKIQLNLTNAFENGGLRTVGVNPDGTPFNFRIINPRQFVLSTTFDF